MQEIELRRILLYFFYQPPPPAPELDGLEASVEDILEDKSEIANQIIEVDADSLGNTNLTTAQIRTESKKQGKEWGKGVLEVTGFARYKAQAKFIFNSSFVKGTMINVVKEKKGWTASNPYKLRISEVSHECSTNGIFTFLTLI